MNRLTNALAAASFAFLAGATLAQAPAGGEPGKRPTPEQREKMKEAYKAAHEACKDKPDHRACMTESMCSKAPDPAKCQANAKERQAKKSKHMDERQAAHEACTGKRGDALMTCLHEQREKSGRGRPDKKG